MAEKRKKFTLEELDRQFEEALHGPLPGGNGQRRLRTSQPGVIQELLKGTKGQPERPEVIKEPPVGGG